MDDLSATGESARQQVDADRCRPSLCALGTVPHAHCVCGLPMPLGSTLCEQCLAEGFNPRPLTVADYVVEWDGRRYPSLRLHRPTDVPPARYDDLLRSILGPVPDRKAEHSTAEEAA